MSLESEIPLGYIYRVTNKLNGKTYIGARYLKFDRKWRDYLGSGKLIAEDIAFYGSENFVKSFLSYAYFKESLYAMEAFYIRQEKSSGSGEYNLFVGNGAGGDTFSLLNESDLQAAKNKISAGLRSGFESGRIVVWNKNQTIETDERLRVKSDKAKFLGTYAKPSNRKYSEEDRAKLSALAAGNSNSQLNSTLEQRSKIATTVSTNVLTKSGKSSLEKHDELLMLDIIALKKNMNKNQLAQHLSVGTTFLTRFLRRHGFSSLRSSEDTLCLICEGRKLESQ